MLFYLILRSAFSFFFVLAPLNLLLLHLLPALAACWNLHCKILLTGRKVRWHFKNCHIGNTVYNRKLDPSVWLLLNLKKKYFERFFTNSVSGITAWRLYSTPFSSSYTSFIHVSNSSADPDPTLKKVRIYNLLHFFNHNNNSLISFKQWTSFAQKIFLFWINILWILV